MILLVLELLATSAPPPPQEKFKPDTSGSIFHTTPRQRSNPHPREGLTNQIPHSQVTENSRITGVCPGNAEVSIRSAQNNMADNESENTASHAPVA